jgi:hypothetical protein
MGFGAIGTSRPTLLCLAFMGSEAQIKLESPHVDCYGDEETAAAFKQAAEQEQRLKVEVVKGFFMRAMLEAQKWNVSVIVDHGRGLKRTIHASQFDFKVMP